MNYLKIFFLLGCFSLVLISPVNAQQKKNFNPLIDDISQMVPPMSVLLDSAYAHDPGLKFAKLQYSIDKGNLRTNQAQWTQNLGLQANVGYGTFDYLYNNNIGNSIPGQSQQQTITTKQNETQYGVGGFLRVPIYDLVNRKNQIRIAKDIMQQAQTLSDTRKTEIQELVIKQYNDMIVKQRILKIKSKYLETSRINTEMAEKAFVKGTISLDDYSRVSDIGSHTETDFESAKMDFISSYMIMEVMTGMNFNITNETPQNNEGN
jgi:outer membrane protein TolC